MATVEGTTHVVHYINPAFCRLMGKTIEQLVGKPLSELLPEKDKCVGLVDRVFRTGKPESYTEQENSKTHPVFWSYTVWPVLADKHLVGVMIQVTEAAEAHGTTVAMNEALMLGSVRQHELTEAAEKLNAQLRLEISERKQAEEALRRAQALLTDRAGQLEGLVSERTSALTSTNKQLEAFVYSIAHDLRAPLRAMQAFSALLVEDGGPTLNAAARDYAARIKKSAGFMDALLTDLLAFSRISQPCVELIPVNLKGVVESVLYDLQKDAEEKHALIETSGVWPVVMAHEPTLTQVLVNLLSNALKFVNPGVPPRVRLRAEVVEAIEASERRSVAAPEREESAHASRSTRLSPQLVAPESDESGSQTKSDHATPSSTVRVWVEDNGPGIDPRHHEQIFGLFTRLDGNKYEGTGIGLAIVQKGIERMGGRVGVESAKGQGSRFWVELRKA
jgi:PAS domain S-box-containing protein